MIVRFSTTPFESTATAMAVRGESRTSRAERTTRASWAGLTTTAAQSVSWASSREVSWSTRSSSPWALREEDLHLLVLGARERLRVAEVVDEEAVALVGRDPPGARVRVGQVALALERRHVGADRRRRDLDDRVAGDLRGPDRLSGLDVAGHDGLQDRGLAIVELVVLVAGGHRQSGSSCGILLGAS